MARSNRTDTDIVFTWSRLQSVTGGTWHPCPPPGSGGIASITTDSRNVMTNALFIALTGDRFDGHDFVLDAVKNNAAAIVVSTPPPDELDVPCLVVCDTLRAYQELAAAHRQRFPNLLIAAITGSSGKTSTKEILGTLLRSHFGNDHVLTTDGNTNNQIGVSHNLLRLNSKHRAAVIELGTSMPGEIKRLSSLVEPHVAVVTSIGAAHLEGLDNVDAVAVEKAAIFDALPPDGLALLPASWRHHPAMVSLDSVDVLTIGADDDTADIRVTYNGGTLTESSFTVDGVWPDRSLHVSWTIPGRHQAHNAAIALAILEHWHLLTADTLAALRQCRLDGMRLQLTTINGVHWLNDAYNANPDSSRALIDCLHEHMSHTRGRCYLVLGDMFELGPEESRYHAELLRYARQKLPTALVLPVGSRMANAADALDYMSFPDLKGVREYLRTHVQAGELIVLKGSRGMALERLMPCRDND